jgi:hypothetical protein
MMLKAIAGVVNPSGRPTASARIVPVLRHCAASAARDSECPPLSGWRNTRSGAGALTDDQDVTGLASEPLGLEADLGYDGVDQDGRSVALVTLGSQRIDHCSDPSVCPSERSSE